MWLINQQILQTRQTGLLLPPKETIMTISRRMNSVLTVVASPIDKALLEVLYKIYDGIIPGFNMATVS